MAHADRLHRARKTGALHVNETPDGMWYAAKRDGLDRSYTPAERWFDRVFLPVLEGIGVWFVLPTFVFFVVFNIVRWVWFR